MSKPIELKLKVLYGNMPDDDRYVHDIYTDLEEIQKAHRFDTIVVGYCIVDAKTKEIHPDTKDWYPTYAEAEDTRIKLMKKYNPIPEIHAMIREIQNGNEIVDTKHVTFRATEDDVYTDELLKRAVMDAIRDCIEEEGLYERPPLSWDDAVELLLKHDSTCIAHGFNCLVKESASIYTVNSIDTCNLN